MNESTPSLDDLALFLLVVECGSLTQAAAHSDSSLPTLSRRMTRLEHDTGRTLFLRGRAGYAPSADGHALAREVSGLVVLQRRVARWIAADRGPRRVRITAGFWTSRHLAQNLPAAQTLGWVPEFVPSDAPLDLARREADIGLRNRAPDHPWLARQKMRKIDYAVYGTAAAPQAFVTLPPGAPAPPSQRWVQDNHGDAIATTARDTRLCLDLVLHGFGRMVMPCFAGRAEPGLTQLSPAIDALTHDEWLVSHHETRHDPPVRAALTAIAEVMSQPSE